MTRRSNEERLGGLPSVGAKEAADIPPMVVDNSVPTELAYVVPTELVELPSGGKLYPEGHALHGVEDIEIKEMTAKEEDILTTESFIRKGTIFDRLIKSIVVDKSIKVDDLLIGDRNAILITARMSGYGPIYETEVTCPDCGAEDKNYGFDLRECPFRPPVDLETEEDTELREFVSKGLGSTYFVTLPKSKMAVEIKLLTGKDERAITQAQAMRKKNKLPENALTEHFKRIILSVNGVTDRIEIDRFIGLMPALDSQFLRKTFRKLTPNVSMTQEFVCDQCDYEQDLEVPMTPRFFWPDA